jgi:hypothetical protein
MVKRRFPPHGKALFSRRSAGDHPPSVRFFWADDFKQVPFGEICVTEPGMYDYRIFAGIAVHVHLVSYRPGFMRTLTEIAEFGAPVTLTLDGVINDAADICPDWTDEQAESYRRRAAFWWAAQFAPIDAAFSQKLIGAAKS